MDLFISLIMAFTIGLFGSPTQAPEVQPTQAHQAPLSQALKDRPIQAPSQATLKAPEVDVTTTPAPTQAPTQAPQIAPIPQGAPGSSAPETAPHAPVQPTVPTQAPVQPPICEEDMPCWDCSENDNRTCIDGTPVESEAPAEPEVFTATPEDSAWASLEALGPDVEQLEGMALVYRSTVTVEPTDLPETQFAVMDTEQFDTWHIFEYVTASKA
jgi:hypothetical protein